MKTGTHTQVPVPTTPQSYWHELRDNQEYRKKIAMKTGTHTQVPVPMTTSLKEFVLPILTS